MRGVRVTRVGGQVGRFRDQLAASVARDEEGLALYLRTHYEPAEADFEAQEVPRAPTRAHAHTHMHTRAHTHAHEGRGFARCTRKLTPPAGFFGFYSCFQYTP